MQQLCFDSIYFFKTWIIQEEEHPVQKFEFFLRRFK